MQVIKSLFLGLLVLVPFVRLHAGNLKDSASVGFDTYSDNGDVQVYSPTLSLMKTLSKNILVGFKMRIDAIAAASIRSGVPSAAADTVASASTRGEEGESDAFDDVRYAPTLMGAYDDGANAGSVGVYYSTEQDYEGMSVFGSYVRQLNEQNTAVGIGFSQSSDRWSPDFDRALPRDDRKERKIDLSVNQLLSPTASVQLVYSYLYSEGFLASPYMYVLRGSAVLYENYPRERTGHALALKGVFLLDPADSMNYGYRYYSDDWGIGSHTLHGEWLHDFGDRVTSGLRLRYYTQGRADFIKPVGAYNAADRYVAADYRMSAFDSYDVGIPFIFRPSVTGDYKITASIDYYQTSDNAYIRNWYGESNLKALYTTLTLQFGN